MPIPSARSAHAVPSDAETMHTMRQPQSPSGIGASVEKESINAHSFVVRIGVESVSSPVFEADIRGNFVPVLGCAS